MPKHENNAFQKKFYNQLKKGAFSVECAPWVIPDWSIKSWIACIASCSRDIPCEVSTCWLPLHFFHVLIIHYHYMAKHIFMITKY